MAADLVVRGGRVVDGTGAPPVEADVAIEDGVITEIGPRLDGTRELDASGQIVAPGFIDIHTHYDAQVFWDPALTPSCWHGVTTVVAGNCGFSLAPCRPEHRGLLARTLEHVEAMSLEALEAGIPWEFETFPQYLDAVERRGTLLNFGAFVGHTPVRLWVMGDEGYEREATEDEIAKMRAVIGEAVDAGAMGFATSSSPTHSGDAGRPVPSRRATKEEIETLALAVSDVGKGILQVLPGEAIKTNDLYPLQQRVGRPLTWTALLTFPGGYHRQALALNTAGRAEGADVWPQMAVRPLSFQFHLKEPFIFDSRPIFSELHGLPPEERKKRYADPSWRARALEDLARGRVPVRWDTFVIEETDQPGVAGRRVSELAEERGISPLDVVLDTGLADNLTTRIRGFLANDDPDGIAEILQDEGVVIGLSDAGAHASQLCDACFSTELLGTFVRERGSIPVERAVRKLTGELSDLLRLGDRGYLRPGAPADLAVFDPDTVAPGPLRRVYDLPAGADRLLADKPTGVTHVVVNGTVIREAGEPVESALESRPGQLLRSTA